MYIQDYDNAQYMFQERLREAEQHRKHQELIRAAEEYARREGRGGFLYRIMQQLQRRNQPQQETADARRAPAL